VLFFILIFGGAPLFAQSGSHLLVVSRIALYKAYSLKSHSEVAGRGAASWHGATVSVPSPGVALPTITSPNLG